MHRTTPGEYEMRVSGSESYALMFLLTMTMLIDVNAGTLVYTCPEWLELGQYHAEPATVWSLGCLLYDMVTGDVPFHNRHQIISSAPHFSDKISPGTVYISTSTLFKLLDFCYMYLNDFYKRESGAIEAVTEIY